MTAAGPELAGGGAPTFFADGAGTRSSIPV
jgi:hypothetical protein